MKVWIIFALFILTCCGCARIQPVPKQELEYDRTHYGSAHGNNDYRMVTHRLTISNF